MIHSKIVVTLFGNLVHLESAMRMTGTTYNSYLAYLYSLTEAGHKFFLVGETSAARTTY